MQSSRCAFCDVPLTPENDSREHLIPNAIGGRKKITGFVCKECNNNTGSAWDAVLAQQLNPLSLLFHIKRERGSVPPQVFESIDGEQYLLHRDQPMTQAKPQYRETRTEEGTHIRITARSEQEASKMIQGVTKKYPQVDSTQVLEHMKTTRGYLKSQLNIPLNFGGEKSGRSLVKSALALAVASGVSPTSCMQACNYLLAKGGEACFGYYYERDLVVQRPKDTVFHCVAVEAFPNRKQLLAYIEFFSAQRMVVSLSDNYEGEPVRASYAVDPRSGKELHITVALDLSPEEIKAAFEYRRIPSGSIEAAYSQVIPLALQDSFEREQKNVLSRAVKQAVEKIGLDDGEVFTAEHVERLTALMMEELEPFLLHRMRANRS